jgi:glutamine amidotransferase
MQLLFDGSEEGDGHGIGLLGGRITRLRADRIPQIGWNEVEDVTEPMVRRSGLTQAYYANSFVARPEHDARICGWSSYQGDRFAAVVADGATLGVQFHPEKSSLPGVALIRAFLDRSRS